MRKKKMCYSPEEKEYIAAMVFGSGETNLQVSGVRDQI